MKPPTKDDFETEQPIDAFAIPPFGPYYPVLGASVAKFRKIKNPTWEQRQAHGEAVEKAIRSLQRSELQKELPGKGPSCLSHTWHNNADGAVGEAVRRQHLNVLLACPEKVRKARTPCEWREMYIEAMKAKHGEGWTYVEDATNY